MTEAVWGMVRSTSVHGIEHTAVALWDRWSEVDRAKAPADCNVRVFQRIGPRSVFFSPALDIFLRERAGDFDIVHIHSIRHWPGLAARRHAMRAKLPLLISLHGALYPQTLQRSGLRKTVIHAMFENSTLRAARCLHATSAQEADVIRQFGCRNPIAMIPLGVNPAVSSAMTAMEEQHWLASRWTSLAKRRYLLFLGMLAPYKGLLRLLAAWSELAHEFPDWHLAIAGTGNDAFEQQLRAEVSKTALHQRVSFLGHLYGTEKDLVLRHASVLVLPSDRENFGLVVAEALSAGVPVIASRTAPWKILEQYACGWWIEPSVSALTSTLRDVMALAPAELAERGIRGRQMLQHRFDWSTTGSELTQVYKWLAGQNTWPGCVSG